MKRLKGGGARWVLLGVVGVAAGLLGACGSTGTAEGPSLVPAERAIQRGYLEDADYYLGVVEREGRLTEPGAAQAKLLRAEIAIQSDLPDEALTLAGEVLESGQLPAAANEMRGKALLRLGRFDEAAGSFVAAGDQYEGLTDKLRSADLENLANGLDAYADGDLAEAKDFWSEIRSKRMLRGLAELGAPVDVVDAPATEQPYDPGYEADGRRGYEPRAYQGDPRGSYRGYQGSGYGRGYYGVPTRPVYGRRTTYWSPRYGTCSTRSRWY